MAASFRRPRGLAAAMAPIPSILLDNNVDPHPNEVREFTYASPSPPPEERVQKREPGEMYCTVCDSSLGSKGRSRRKQNHPLLNVPICTDCLATYESGDFLLSEEDGHEIYCRWCGDGPGR